MDWCSGPATVAQLLDGEKQEPPFGLTSLLGRDLASTPPLRRPTLLSHGNLVREQFQEQIHLVSLQEPSRGVKRGHCSFVQDS